MNAQQKAAAERLRKAGLKGGVFGSGSFYLWPVKVPTLEIKEVSVFEFRCAYRYQNGEVEGFHGHALSSAARAKEDAMEQIRRKITHIPRESFDASRVIHDAVGLSGRELEDVKTDWTLNVRYC